MFNDKYNKKTLIWFYILFIILQLILLFFAVFLGIGITNNANYLIALDNFVFNLISYLRCEFINNLALLLTFLGETITIISLLIISIIILKKKSLPLIFTITSSALLNFILKNLFQRERPVGQFVNNLIINYPFPTSFSLPSGHSQNGLVFYFILVYILLNSFYKGKHKTLFLLLTIILTILIMLSRLILGVHYFTDILFGAFLGTIIILFYLFITKHYDKSIIKK